MTCHNSVFFWGAFCVIVLVKKSFLDVNPLKPISWKPGTLCSRLVREINDFFQKLLYPRSSIHNTCIKRGAGNRLSKIEGLPTEKNRGSGPPNLSHPNKGSTNAWVTGVARTSATERALHMMAVYWKLDITSFAAEQ